MLPLLLYRPRYKLANRLVQQNSQRYKLVSKIGIPEHCKVGALYQTHLGVYKKTTDKSQFHLKTANMQQQPEVIESLGSICATPFVTTDMLVGGSLEELEAILAEGADPDKLLQGNTPIALEIDEHGSWLVTAQKDDVSPFFPGPPMAFLQHRWLHTDAITGQPNGEAAYTTIGRMLMLLLRYGACLDTPLTSKVGCGVYAETNEPVTMTVLTMAVLQLAVVSHNEIEVGSSYKNASLVCLITMYLRLGADLDQLRPRYLEHRLRRSPSKLTQIIDNVVRLPRVNAILQNYLTDQETLKPHVYLLKHLTPIGSRFPVRFDRLLQELNPCQIWTYLYNYVGRSTTYVIYMPPHMSSIAANWSGCAEELTKLRHAFRWSEHQPKEFPWAFRRVLLIVLAFAQKADHWLGYMLSSSIDRPITILDRLADSIPLDHFPLPEQLTNSQLGRKRKQDEQCTRKLHLALYSYTHT